MDSADGWGDDVYQPDGSEVQDDAGLLDAEDTLETDGVDDPLDRGWIGRASCRERVLTDV